MMALTIKLDKNLQGRGGLLFLFLSLSQFSWTQLHISFGDHTSLCQGHLNQLGNSLSPGW